MPDYVACTCLHCKKPYFYDRAKRGTKDVCPTCMNSRHRWHLKDFMVRYKGGSCQLCGYNRCMGSLDFHHVDPATKSFNLAGSHCRSWDLLRAELDKCVCLCRNCHNEAHEAAHDLVWGNPDPGILRRIDEIHAEFVPDRTMHYTRDGWQAFHPMYRNRAA